MESSEVIINQTKKWIKTVVIGLRFCPFAGKPFFSDAIDYVIDDFGSQASVSESLLQIWNKMDAQASVDTALLLLPNNFADFHTYLQLLEDSENLLRKQGYEGYYQLAGFHPQYMFHGSSDADAANYTNRSPYPMIHILREDAITKAVTDYPDVALIPEKNINLATQKGLAAMQALLTESMNPD